MAYNNGFPIGYQPAYYQPAQSNGIIWVQGESGAKSYMVAPNQTVQLWDSESQTIYLKSADASGMPSMRILDYKIRDAQQGIPKVSLDKYATKDDISDLRAKIEELREELNKYSLGEENGK